MKKNFLLSLAVVLILNCAPNKTVEKTVVGYFTPYFLYPETVKGRVKEIKELNFWAFEKNGVIEAGKPISISDRDSLLIWSNDFIVNYDPTGLVEKVTYLNENGKTTGYWDISNEAGKLKSANWIGNDTIRTQMRKTIENNNIQQFELFNSKTDTFLSKFNIAFGDNGKFREIQMFNYKQEPTTKNEYTYDNEGNLSGYTWTYNDTIRGGMNFKYNENGYSTTQEVINKKTGVKSTYTYEYESDGTGNWIKYLAYEEGKLKVVGKRTYVYY